ncbi:hypothetical protein CHRYSEOSP005_06700 [Chryseobacterium sp. Alg-005]|uniref:hypothetical protein n=1 Tax=Chryseobacterium sp. Alg-005 TaxID=3159516 RepID=UPI003555B63D
MGKKKNSQRKKPGLISKLTIHNLNWLEWSAIFFSIWFIFYPKPYEFLLIILLLFPIVGILLNGIHQPSIITLVKISKDENGNDEYDVADFIDIISWAILIRVIIDYDFESFLSLIIPGAVAFVLVVIILFSTHQLIASSTKNKWWIYCSLLFNIFVYSYAGTYAINCTFDNSKPQVYKTTILSKRISEGRRSTSYLVEITPWGNRSEKEEISISKTQFGKLYVGDHINVDIKKGLFNIPWYYVEDN